MIEFQCPQCRESLYVEFPGQSGVCSKCGSKYFAPSIVPPPIPYAGQTRSSNSRTCLIVGIVAAVVGVCAIPFVAIVAAIAIPNLLRSRLSANESAAIGAMRTIASGQASYQASGELDADKDGIGEYGTLSDLVGANPPYIDPVLGAGQKQGYTFVCKPNEDGESGYTCHADPLVSGRTGNRHFFVDESGVITFNPTRPANADDNPA